MIQQLKNAVEIARNMGIRYVWFRLWYETKKRTGILKKAFPTAPPTQNFILLSEWKAQNTTPNAPRFFPVEAPKAPLEPGALLSEQQTKDQREQILFFNATTYKVTDWLTNPLNGYRYDATKHWTEVADLSAAAGDIKYVWEKSRFSYIYQFIRQQQRGGYDAAELVFSEIDSWIEANPINCGPNWRCSQEISLRVLNWTFALHYYQHSPALNAARFERIVHLIRWQTHHVYKNIDFSRIAVRNNHAITETLCLYLVGMLYPFFPEAAEWKKRGKRWFETEIEYQVYDDGTFLQFSMNYHRVVVQLLTWAVRLADLNGERFADVVYERAKKTLDFLVACQDPQTGWLPNYGNNDGALFFPLNNCHYRNYRPQLLALARTLNETINYENGPWQEDLLWYGLSIEPPKPAPPTASPTSPNGALAWPTGGYALVRDADTLAFLRCGNHRDRPLQADNLHLDLWVAGRNILRDAGSYQYNTDEETLRFFMGTASHNTVMLGQRDQMQKGPRFVWYGWTQATYNRVTETADSYVFEGQIVAFKQLGARILHSRRVTKLKNKRHWIVEDTVEHDASWTMEQVWNPSDDFFEEFKITAHDRDGTEIAPTYSKGWYSGLYGQKEPTQRIIFATKGKFVKTEIVQ